MVQLAEGHLLHLVRTMEMDSTSMEEVLLGVDHPLEGDRHPVVVPLKVVDPMDEEVEAVAILTTLSLCPMGRQCTSRPNSRSTLTFLGCQM